MEAEELVETALAGFDRREAILVESLPGCWFCDPSGTPMWKSRRVSPAALPK
jgi:hypothetical protein